MKLSILIKTLNEEARIAKCLNSVRDACAHLSEHDVEVIVADSLSSDRTVEIAAQLGAKVVQLNRTGDRGCGAGVQLGYQHSSGEFVMLLDADMQINPQFLPLALSEMETDPTLGGVAGLLEDTEVRNWFDRRRTQTKGAETAKNVEWLTGGGLFRRQAIEESGAYAGNRNLRAFEEAELGMRLNCRGWRLRRLACPGVQHTGHVASSLGLIRRDWVSGRMDSAGVLMRQALGKPWFWTAVRLFAHPIGVIGYWIGFFSAWYFLSLKMAAGLAAAILVCVILALTVRKRSLVDAVLSVLLWHLAAIGLARGLLRKLVPPQTLIDSSVVAGH